MELDLTTLLNSAPTVLAFGEPTHGEQAFLRIRNQLFAALVERGFRSIALESDRVAALDVDAYVRGEVETMRTDGFSHNFGRFAANRELVAWMREYNESHDEQLAFYGFDAPVEMTSAPSPRRYLHELCAYVAPGRWAELDALLGDDERWDEVFDPALSIGASAEAVALRAATDDLIGALYASAPRLVAASSVAAWRRAEVYGTAARGLLRYHAQAAVDGPDRTSRMSGVRDACMAQNLLDIRVVEQHRGPTLVFAHNRHVQRYTSRLRFGGTDLEWSSAGSILSTLLGDRYAVITGSLGAAPPGTFEGALDAEGEGLFAAARVRELTRGLAPRTDVNRAQGFLPLAAEDIEHTDAVLHVAPSARPESGDEPASSVPPGPSAKDSAAQMSLWPDVSTVVATEANGAPESNWGNYFFSVRGDEYRPFATIVVRDMPGFDEESQLDRPGIYRLNIHAGREEFQRRFGFAPREFAARRGDYDFAALDQVLPHPVYGDQGWVCVLNPNDTLADVIGLVELAHRNAAARQQRRESQRT
jgi:erythromycin esterase-like protein